MIKLIIEHESRFKTKMAANLGSIIIPILLLLIDVVRRFDYFGI